MFSFSQMVCMANILFSHVEYNRQARTKPNALCSIRKIDYFSVFNKNLHVKHHAK